MAIQENVIDWMPYRCVCTQYHSWSESWVMREKKARYTSAMHPQWLSRPGSVSAPVTGKGDSFEMICLYVVFNVIYLIFLSTTFARIRPLCSRRSLVITLFHHCYSFCIKFMQILNRYCPFLTWLQYGLFYVWVKSILRLDLTFPS